MRLLRAALSAGRSSGNGGLGPARGFCEGSYGGGASARGFSLTDAVFSAMVATIARLI